MSSWKKASKTGQKFHKERGQLEERRHLGLLEKKKDYKLRAKDFQEKRDLLINLKRKILEKNPDEFYFNMVKTQMKDGVHKLKNPFVDYTEDELKLMKSQDKNYIKFHQQIESKKIEKLKSTMHLIDVADMPKNQHRFFVDEHREAKNFNLAKKFNTHESLLDRRSNRLTMDQLEHLELPWMDIEFQKEMKKNRSKNFKELIHRVNRNESLLKLESTYDLKITSMDPEQEYDDKYVQNSKSTNLADQPKSHKYSKMNSWSIISNNSNNNNNNNKTGKITIPILNSTSPHNYVIMPALLAHVDSSLSSTCFSPSQIRRHSNTTESNLRSSLCAAKSRRYKKLNSLNSNSICNEKNFSSLFKSSKEIIYTTKKIKPLNSIEEKFTESALNGPSLLSTINENFFSRSDHNHPTSYFDFSSYRVMVGKEVPDSNIDYSQHELNQNSTSCNFTQIETSEPFTRDNTNSSITTTHRLDSSSLINMIPNSDAKPSESYINESTISTPEYLSLFNQLATTTLDNQDIASRYVNCYHETPSSLRLDQNQEVESVFSNNNQITYAISYPSDSQYNLDSLVNCYVAFKNIKTQNILSNTVQLKCSVCEAEFVCLIDLVKHKEENDFCKINVKISTENNSSSKFFLAPVNKRKSYLINHLENEEEESDYEYEEVINESGQSFFFDTDTDEEEAILFDEIIDSSDESSLNDDLSLYSNQKNGELTKKIYKSHIEFNKSKSSKTILLEPSSARHKYTKNRNDPKNFSNSTCEICLKNCKTKAELLVHKHKHAGHDAECWQCGKKCASFSNLISHIQLHTGEKPYTCQFCGKQFTQDAHLTRHVRLHTGERPFTCEICGKNYKDYSYYKTHLRIHRGERLYKCKFCNKEYYDASYYKKHTRLHTGEKPYMCTVCGRQFHRSDYLKLHSFSHTNERPFNCHICGKGFKMNYNLKIHLKHHKNEQSNIASANDENSYLDSINNISSDNYLNTFELMVEQSNDLNSSSINLLSTSVSNEMASFLNESM